MKKPLVGKRSIFRRRTLNTKPPLIIAHRGAPGYLPEHTLAGKALAHAMGADFLEQDVVVSRDDELVVLHDIYLDHVTDVVERFPRRCREDGRWYARDFSVAEMRSLSVTERLLDDRSAACYPGRFPARVGRFKIPTFAEELEFIHGLNGSTGRTVGIYPEIKRPLWHREEGIEAGDLLLDCLAYYGYTDEESPVFVQCFDFAELTRLRERHGTRLKLIQLVGENAWQESPTDFDWFRTPAGLAAVAEIATGIGPWLGHILPHPAAGPGDQPTPLIAEAHAAGLVVHPYTFRADALPEGFQSLEALMAWCIDVAGVDGLFTDFPDRAVRFVDAGRRLRR